MLHAKHKKNEAADPPDAVNAGVEEVYWRERYERESYYQAGHNYDDYGPAYTLGWSSVSLYGTEFEHVEPELEKQWERQRGNSGLTWAHAREATRAAWDKVKRASSSDAAAPLRGDSLVRVLNDLVEACHDGEYGFKVCIERAHASNLKTLFEQRMRFYATAVADLSDQVLRLGGTPPGGGTMSGAAHRGWVTVRSMLSHDSDHAIVDECLRGEDITLARYGKALLLNLPVDVRALLERQRDSVQASHVQIKDLRDDYKMGYR